MDITIINGSPKRTPSNSAFVAKLLKERLTAHSVSTFNISRIKKQEVEQLHPIGEALVFVFPLYVDSIPSHLMRFLQELEGAEELRQTTVYCCLNNGFFEGEQNHVAVNQMKLWCQRVGARWGQAIGIGSGETLRSLSSIPLGKGPNKNLGNALANFVANIENLESDEDFFFSPNMPRSLWMVMASKMFWLPQAKKNRLRKEDLYRRM